MINLIVLLLALAGLQLLGMEAYGPAYLVCGVALAVECAWYRRVEARGRRRTPGGMKKPGAGATVPGKKVVKPHAFTMAGHVQCRRPVHTKANERGL